MTPYQQLWLRIRALRSSKVRRLKEETPKVLPPGGGGPVPPLRKGDDSPPYNPMSDPVSPLNPLSPFSPLNPANVFDM